MPAIDVFAGAEELASDTFLGQPITGLPEREQYETWVSEQESMEKEMEFFDKGEFQALCLRTPILTHFRAIGDLNRLKKFAKGRWQVVGPWDHH